MLTVSDDGPGIPEMERSILEDGEEGPLTHSQGLGLWVVWTVVKQSGGELAISTSEGGGTSVQITLERAPTGTTSRPAVARSAPDLAEL